MKSLGSIFRTLTIQNTLFPVRIGYFINQKKRKIKDKINRSPVRVTYLQNQGRMGAVPNQPVAAENNAVDGETLSRGISLQWPSIG
jgi:hypothetical protein